MATCASCGTEHGPAAKFCAECGARLAAPDRAREERRTVTVLFADLVGFTSRSERLDPEDVRAFLVPYYDALTSEVIAHGGRVDRFLGDGIMAIFGAPTAHEDDPERAVRAALRIAERVPALGLDLHVRLGVNTGEVLFVPAGPGDERDDAVTGDAVNTAARLQAAAPADGVVVGEATWHATQHAIRYEGLRPIAAKGKAEPVALWRAVEAIGRATGALFEERTPFVGRELELQILVHLFERSRSAPNIEVVTIVADPGLGKSRLIRELARYVDALPDLVTWRVGRCLPYGEGAGFWALGEVVKAQAGILDTDDQDAIGAKLDDVLREPDPDLGHWMRDRVGPLVGLETASAPPQGEEAYTAWRRFIESIASAGPLVLVIEDLHWADAGLVAFLQHLAANTSGLPILLVATARPEIEQRHPSWLARARRSTVLSLDALSTEDTLALIRATVPSASPYLLAVIGERAAGSPLYAEQIAAMVRDRPSGAVLGADAIPPTVHALLAARIDALPPDAREVLLDASVVGRTFWEGGVAALAGREPADVRPHLAELTRRDLVRPVRPSVMAGEDEFVFVHALIREVAYGTLPRGARANLHIAAATWIASKAPDRISELADLLAHHYTSALDLAEAAGDTTQAAELRAIALRFLALAGDRALGLDTAAALASFERALARTPEDDPDRALALTRYGEAAYQAGRLGDAKGALEHALGKYRAIGDRRGAGQVIHSLAGVLIELGDPRGLELSAEALAELAPLATGPEHVIALADAAATEAVMAHAEAAIGYAEQAISLAAELGLPKSARALEFRGVARCQLGIRSGLDDLRAAIEVATQAGQGREVANLHGNLAEELRLAEGPVKALIEVETGIAVAQARGLAGLAMGLTAIKLDLLVERGECDLALDLAARLVTDLADSDDLLDLMRTRRTQARILALRGRAGEIADTLDWIEASSLASGTVDRLDGLGSSALARVALGQGDAAAELLREVAASAVLGEMTERVPALVRAALQLGDLDLAQRLVAGLAPIWPYTEYAITSANAALAEARGQHEVAATGYADAARQWGFFGVVTEEAFALVGLGRCSLAGGRRSEASRALGQARPILERLGAAPLLAETDALLAMIG